MKLLIAVSAAESNYEQIILTAQRQLEGTNGDNIQIDALLYCHKVSNIQYTFSSFTGTAYSVVYPVISAECLAQTICELTIKNGYMGIVFAGGDLSSDTAVLVAGELDCSCVTGAIDLELKNGKLLCSKYVHNNVLLAKYELPIPFSVSAFFREYEAGIMSGVLPQRFELINKSDINFIFREEILEKRNRPDKKRVLIVAGMGIASRDEMTAINEYADRNGFDFGVSRPVAMRGWASVDSIIGVSGRILSPELTITIGVSGSAAFYAGIENSRFILSVNTDREAKIASLSDAVIVDDYRNVVPELFTRIKKHVPTK